MNLMVAMSFVFRLDVNQADPQSREKSGKRTEQRRRAPAGSAEWL
jgi:hypothetical protein